MWKTYAIDVKYLDEYEFKTIKHQVKARNKEEAEKKAGRYLSGRGAMLFKVTEA